MPPKRRPPKPLPIPPKAVETTRALPETNGVPQPEPVVKPLPNTPSDRLYFNAREIVLNHEVKEFLGKRDFSGIESTLRSHGEFLERHPEA